MLKRSQLHLARSVKAAVVRNSVQDVFAQRLKRSKEAARTLVIASPWITSEAPPVNALEIITGVINRYRIPTYIFTRTPRDLAHRRAVDTLCNCSSAEIVLNDNLHAKVYVCLAPSPYGFALLGSANLTDGSSRLYELGLLVLATGGGEETVRGIGFLWIGLFADTP